MQVFASEGLVGMIMARNKLPFQWQAQGR